jgi:hypothetical protein
VRENAGSFLIRERLTSKKKDTYGVIDKICQVG